jgi:aryl-alcohol dehydrogenase-like predicted oxidoreductase
MKITTLGKTGFKVSALGHGLWGMGGWTDADDSVSRNAIAMAVEGGVSFFDSAFAYGEGHSDQLLGEAARRHAEKPMVLASKIPPANWTWPSNPKNALSEVFPRAHVREYAGRIRAAFGRPIDVLQFHVWEDVWAKEAEWQDTVSELKREGVIKAFGLSLNRWEPENGLEAIETGHVDCVQVIYNIFDQAPEDVLFPVCLEKNVGVVARVPLDEGSLGGKMSLETRFPPDDWRSRYFCEENLVPTIARVEELKKAVPEGMSLPEMALRFSWSHAAVSTVIVGMRGEAHVRANIAAAEKGDLPADLISSLRLHRWDRKPAKWSD